MDIFDHAREIALSKITTWLPGGEVKGAEYSVLNPTRNDNHIGSLNINLKTGKFIDNADDNFVGRDAVTLYALINGLRNYDAAKQIIEKYDPANSIEYKNVKEKDTWYQCVRGNSNAPELPRQRNEIARWPLEANSGKNWRTAMWIVRTVDATWKKTDYPYTLWTNSQTFEWRCKALHGVKYPMYGLRRLLENPNKPVILYEGQKCPSIVQPVIGEDWVCVGYYGGCGNFALTDFEPLIGREVWYPFDADNPGRKKLLDLIKTLQAKVHLVYPPLNVKKGWDHADAIASGTTKEELEVLLCDSLVVKENTPTLLTPDTRPTNLEPEITKDEREVILSNIYITGHDKNGEPVRKLKSDWFFWLVENDTCIRNSLKYDYTTGTASTRYDSSDLYDANLENRILRMGLPANVITKTIKERMVKDVLRRNCKYNRVLDYMDSLVDRFPDVGSSVIDEFMGVFDFCTDEDYNTIKTLYKELFDKFFMRMHVHINGTRKLEDGEYVGVIENDIVPILEGPQGKGKTTLCRWLACDDELYVDLGSGVKTGFGSPDMIKKIRGRLIAEIGEMRVMKKSEDVEAVKSFISQKFLTVDIKYVEKQRDMPVTVSFMGTDNSGQYLIDDSGNRRFWPVRINAIDIKFLAENKELCYKLHAYYAKKAREMSVKEMFAYCKPTEELEAFMEKQRKEAMITYSDYEVCIAVINEWKTDYQNKGKPLTQAEIEKMAIKSGYPARIGRTSAQRAMKDCGLTRTRINIKGTNNTNLAWIWDEIPF